MSQQHPTVRRAGARARIWSADEDARLRRLCDAGLSSSDLAKAFAGRSMAMILNRAAKLGVTVILRPNLSATRPPAGLDGEIIRLCSYLKDDSMIAVYLGCKRERVEVLRQRVAPARAVYGNRDIDQASADVISFSVERERQDRRASDKLRDRMLAAFDREAAATGTDQTTAMVVCLYGRDAAARFTTSQGARP